MLGIVGESGSGKSVTMRAVLGLLPPTARIRGSVRFHGQELLGRSRRLLRALRGKRIGMIFQDPMTALNPVITIGEQIVEAIRIHDRAISHQKALARAVELLELVAIPFPERRVRQYPHEFSGGMRQRAVIAMAMANGPELADRRRAHHGPRRHGPGPDPGCAGAPPGRARGQPRPHHP